MSNNPEESFKTNLSKVVKDYPLQSVIFTIPILIAVGSAGMGLNSAIYENNKDEIVSLEEENKKLKEENEKLNLVIGDVKELYNKNIIFQTDKPLGINETITILNGGVIIKFDAVYGSYVKFEFSFEGKTTYEMEERWREGSVTKRIPFEYEGKTYFIVLDRIDGNYVSFTVYLKE